MLHHQTFFPKLRNGLHSRMACLQKVGLPLLCAPQVWMLYSWSGDFRTVLQPSLSFFRLLHWLPFLFFCVTHNTETISGLVFSLVPHESRTAHTVPWPCFGLLLSNYSESYFTSITEVGAYGFRDKSFMLALLSFLATFHTDPFINGAVRKLACQIVIVAVIFPSPDLVPSPPAPLCPFCKEETANFLQEDGF